MLEELQEQLSFRRNIELVVDAPLIAFAQQPKPGGKIVFAARQDIDTLDPHITNRAATRKILIQFTDTLTVINPKDGKVLPGLAESWEVARDGKSEQLRDLAALALGKVRDEH